MPLPGIDSLFGSMLIGVFLNNVLYGVFVLQAFIYYQTYRRDSAWIRYFVLYLFVMETLNSSFDIGIMYEPLILRNGTSRATTIIPKMLPSGLIATPVQCFIAWRVKVITKSTILSLIIVLFSTVAFAGGLWTGITIGTKPQFATISMRATDSAVITWLTSSAVTDILITLSLSYSLFKSKTGIKATDDQVSRIIRFTVHTGALTSLVAILDVVVFASASIPTVVYAWDFCLPKLYSNVLLSTLNARAGWDNLNGQHHSHNVLFGENPSLSSASSRSTGAKGPHSARVEPEKVFELSTFRCEPGMISTTGSTAAIDVDQSCDGAMKIQATRAMEISHDTLAIEHRGAENV